MISMVLPIDEDRNKEVTPTKPGLNPTSSVITTTDNDGRRIRRALYLKDEYIVADDEADHR